MKKKNFWILVLIPLILSLFANAKAATNPDLAALLQAKVVQFTGTEHISRPFAFDIEITVPNPALKFQYRGTTIAVDRGTRKGSCRHGGEP